MLSGHRLGALGEDLAEAHLRSSGHDVIARNFRCRRGEIDIVCRRRGEIVLVEVKTRSVVARGTPLEAVGDSKLKAMAGCVEEYRAASGWRGPIRFKVVGITIEVLDDVLA